MISKKQYCEIIIEDFCKDTGITRNELSEGYIYQSSALAVAMEYLGLIKQKENQHYTASRGGIVDTYVDYENCIYNVLTVREMLDLLPETVDNQIEN